MEESADLFGEGVKKAETAKQEQQQDNDEDDDEDDDEDEGEAGGAGSAAAASSAAAAAGGAEEEGEGEGGGEGQEAEAVAISEEVQDDLEVAWENLEAARVIYTKHEAEVRALGSRGVSVKSAVPSSFSISNQPTNQSPIPANDRRWSRSGWARCTSAWATCRNAMATTDRPSRTTTPRSASTRPWWGRTAASSRTYVRTYRQTDRHTYTRAAAGGRALVLSLIVNLGGS